MKALTVSSVVAVALVGFLAVASVASAATISNPLFSNGQTTIDANGSATVSGTFTLTVGPGEVVEFLRTQSDPSQPFVDASVGGQLGYQEQVYTNIPFSVKVPPNTGTFYPTVQGAGIFGGNRAINGGDSVVMGPTNLGTVRVVANATGSGSTDTSGMVPVLVNGVTIMVPAWAVPLFANLGSTPAPATACAEYASVSAGLSVGSDTRVGGRVGKLQSFLMYKGFDIPFLSSNQAPYGYYGTQTRDAAAGFVSANHCN